MLKCRARTAPALADLNSPPIELMRVSEHAGFIDFLDTSVRDLPSWFSIRFDAMPDNSARWVQIGPVLIGWQAASVSVALEADQKGCAAHTSIAEAQSRAIPPPSTTRSSSLRA
jgi:hypothetical protein